MDYSACFIKYRFEGRKSIGKKTVRGLKELIARINERLKFDHKFIK